MSKILLHSCCAPCAGHSVQKLISDGYSPTLFFYNPNIYPIQEYNKRKEEIIRFARQTKIPIIIIEDDQKEWEEYITGFESEKEGGKRCELCFKFRLKKTALYAKEHQFNSFCTVLTISPHKNSSLINKIGKQLEEKYNLFFIEENFKKNEGFKKSLDLSKKYGFYRQKYCGCKYSIKKEL